MQFPNLLRIMLVDDDMDRTTSVEESLRALGFYVVLIKSAASTSLFQIEQHRPDLVLIHLQCPGRDILESLAVINNHKPLPVVMFSQESDPDYIRQAIEAGVSSYLLEDIQAEKIKPIIDIALAHFGYSQALRDELDAIKVEFETQRLIAQAKGLLMRQNKITENEAHLMLNRLAMNNNMKLSEVARKAIATLSLVGTSNTE